MRSEGKSVSRWIETYCVVPSGLNKGTFVKLTPLQRETIIGIYDDPESVRTRRHVTGEIAAYLALVHICGPQAAEQGPVPALDADPWTVWNATGPHLKAVLKREPDGVACPELGTRFPRRAA